MHRNNSECLDGTALQAGSSDLGSLADLILPCFSQRRFASFTKYVWHEEGKKKYSYGLGV